MEQCGDRTQSVGAILHEQSEGGDNVDIHVHIHNEGDETWHRHIESVLNRIEGKVNKLATAEQWQALAGEINAATNEIATDIEQLIGRLGEVPDGVMAETTAIVARLKAVAGAYTPPESPTPGAAPGETPLPE